MIPRRKLDISWMDLLTGIISCLCFHNREELERDIESLWTSERQSLTSLSVRSGFDALLQALDLPEESEVLVSAITIPHIITIIRKHGLVPIPIDLDVQSLSVSRSELESAVNNRTKAILIAHMFGSRMPLDDILNFAKAHQLLVIEDCAQAYTGLDYKGDPRADVSLFSFGSIKTSTALGGAILNIRNPELRHKIKAVQSGYTVQHRFFFLSKIIKYSAIKLLMYEFVYSFFVRLCKMARTNHDEIINRNSRNFKAAYLFEQLRLQPCTPLLALMKRRFMKWDPQVIQLRINNAKCLIELNSQIHYPGNAASYHGFWLFPLLAPKPAALVSALWENGFDATQGGARLLALTNSNNPSIRGTCNNAKYIVDKAVYLPLNPGLGMDDLNKLADVLNQYLQQHHN